MLLSVYSPNFCINYSIKVNVVLVEIRLDSLRVVVVCKSYGTISSGTMV